MRVERILYHPEFVTELQKLPELIQRRAVKAEEVFRENPLHPSLRLHRLHGRLVGSWSISVNMKIRILFTRQESGDIVFYSIGRHAIYKKV